jgi:hypothetical protein
MLAIATECVQFLEPDSVLGVAAVWSGGGTLLHLCYFDSWEWSY